MSKYTWLKTFEALNRVWCHWGSEYQGLDDLKSICTTWIESRWKNTPIKFIGDNNPYYKGNNKTYRPDLRYRITWPSFYIWVKRNTSKQKFGDTLVNSKIIIPCEKDINQSDQSKKSNLKLKNGIKKSRFSDGNFIDFDSRSLKKNLQK